MIERSIVSPAQELTAARREALANARPVEPTDEERRNGWSTETLTAYLAERFAAQCLTVDVTSLQRNRMRRKNEQNHHYRPLRWRA